jgi:hypothetical protein
MTRIFRLGAHRAARAMARLQLIVDEAIGRVIGEWEDYPALATSVDARRENVKQAARTSGKGSANGPTGGAVTR